MSPRHAARGGGRDRGTEPRGGNREGGRQPAREPAREPAAAILYGRNPVREALRGRRRVRRIWATSGALQHEPWLAGAGAEVVASSAGQISERCGSTAHQGVCAQVDPYPYAGTGELLAVSGFLLVALDEVTDPQNLGAVARTAEVVGATGVVIPERRSADVTPAVCKASAGAVEHLRIARVRNLADFLTDAKAAGAWIYGASADATVSYRAPDYRGAVVLVLGAEGRGLRPRVAAGCDLLVALPRRGRLDSLNVSAAAAVLLYEILHHRLDTES